MSAAPETTLLDLDHPWPGPDSFRQQDARFFRGRDTEIRDLLRLVRRARSVVLYGASGLGKTSLINAGLVPNLPADEYLAAPIRVSYVPGAPSVADQIQAEIQRSRSSAGLPCPRPRSTVWELLHLRDEPLEGPQPLIILDQFEELFTIGSSTPQAAELVEELKALVEGVPPMRVRERLERAPDEARAFAFQRSTHRALLSVREDFLYGLEGLRAQLPSIIYNRYRIGPFSGTQALEVVMQRASPAVADATAGAGGGAALVGRDVAELIVRTVASSALDHRPLESLEIEPALLSILCAELARRRSPGTPITADLVRGSRTEIISSFYERALADAPPAVRAFVEEALVTPTGYRTSAVVSEALAVPGFTREVLFGLVNRRLLRVVDRPSGKWIELTHDILTEIAARSRALRHERLRLEREAAARLEHERAERLAAEARDAARHRRARTIVGGLAVVVLALVLYAWYASTLWRAADEAKHALRERYVDATLGQRHYRDALVQLATAVKEQPDAVWARALAGDLLLRRGWPRPTRPVFPDGPFTWLDCDDDGTRCAAAYRDGRVLVRGDLVLDLRTGQQGYAAVIMSRDGQRLLFVPELAGTVIQFGLGPSGPREVRIPLKDQRIGYAASADTRVVALPFRTLLEVWQLAPGPYPPLTLERRLARAPFDLSLDGRWLAYADPHTVNLVEVTDVRPVPRAFPAACDGPIGKILIDPDSTILHAACGSVFLRWRLADGTPLPALRARRPIVNATFAPSGDRLVLTLEGGALELWRPPWAEPLQLLSGSGGVVTLRFAADSRWLSASTRDGLVSFWDADGRPLGEPVRHEGLAFAQPAGPRALLTADLGGASASWTIVPPMVRPSTASLGEPVRFAWFLDEDAFFAYGIYRYMLERAGEAPVRRELPRPRVVLSPDRDQVVSIYAGQVDIREGLPPAATPDGADQTLVADSASGQAFSGDGTRLLVAAGGKGYLFDVATRRQLEPPIDGVVDGWLNHDGTRLATKGSDVGVTIWRRAPGGALTREADVDTLGRVAHYVAFSRSDDAVVIATENRARVWSLRERRFVGAPAVHRSAILRTEFSPDGRWFATASEDGRARIWEVATGRPASAWFEHDSAVNTAAFSPSGRRILTGTASGELRVWDLFVPGEGEGDEERLWLARLAESLSGMRIDPRTNEVVLAPHPEEALARLRDDVERACPGAAPSPRCASPTARLVRAVLAAGVDASAGPFAPGER